MLSVPRVIIVQITESTVFVFIVILIEQILGADNRLPAWLAFVSAIVCLLIFGPSNFILPSLVITVALLSILRHRIEPVKAVKEEKEEA